MVFVNVKLLGHVVCHFLAVACQHDGLPDAQCLELSNGFGTVVFDFIVDDDMSCIDAVDGYVDDSAHMMAVVPFGANAVHQFRVTYSHPMFFNTGHDGRWLRRGRHRAGQPRWGGWRNARHGLPGGAIGVLNKCRDELPRQQTVHG